MKAVKSFLWLYKLVVFALALLLTGFHALTNSSTPPAGNTGAPGDANCTGCHTGSVVTSGANWNNIGLTSNIPATGYVPGQTYTITLSHTQSGITKFGFQTTILNGSSLMAGSITVTDAANTSTQTSGSRTYINHTSAGTAGSGSISWSFNWTAPSTGAGTITFYTAINATNSSASSAGDIIYLKSFAFQQHNNSPTAIINANKTTICAGDTIRYQGSGLNTPTSYSWLFPGGSPSNSSQQNPNIIYNTPGTFNTRLITTNASGSSTPTFLSVTVRPKPSSTIISSGQAIICGNDSLFMTGAGGVNYRYLWTPNNDTTRSITVINAGIYQLTITDSNQCSAKSVPVNVKKKSRPSVSLTVSKDSICSGDSVEFTATSPDQILTYTFFATGTNAQIFQTNASPLYKTVLTSTLDSFSVASADSFCTSFAAPLMRVWVKQKLKTPTVTVGMVTSHSLQFNWDSIPDALGYEVSIDTGKTWIQPSSGSLGNGHTIGGLAPNQTVYIMVRAVDSYPCNRSESGSAFATSGVCPAITARFKFDSAVCLLSDTSTVIRLVSIDSLNVSNYGISYNNGIFGKQMTLNLPVTKGLNQLNIRIVDSNNFTCPLLDTSITLTGVHEPAFTSRIQLLKPVCVNHDLDIAFDLVPSPRYKLSFIKNDSIFQDTGNRYTVPLTNLVNGDKITGIYTDTITGCSKRTNEIVIDKKDLPVPAFKVAKENLKLQLTDTSMMVARRLWKVSLGSSVAEDTAVTANFLLAAPGLYTAELTVWNGDSCFSALTKQVNIVSTGVATSAMDKWVVFPNPVIDKLSISCPPVFSDMVLQLFDLKGKEVLTLPFTGGEGNVDLGALPGGLYFYTLTGGHGIKTGKLIKK